MPLNLPILGPQNTQTSLGILFPFQESTAGGIFATTKTTLQSTRSDLTAFLTTPQYARRMHNDLYSPLPGFIFEQADDLSLDNLKTELSNKIIKYFPEISLIDIVFDFDGDTHILNVTVKYAIPSIGVSNGAVTIALQMATL